MNAEVPSTSRSHKTNTACTEPPNTMVQTAMDPPATSHTDSATVGAARVDATSPQSAGHDADSSAHDERDSRTSSWSYALGSLAHSTGALSELDYDAGDHEELVCKVVMLGDSAVGKSSLVRSYHSKTFSTSMSSTIAVDYVQTRQFLPHRKATVAAEIWDTAGQEQFRSVTRAFYRGLTAAMVVFSVTDRASFDKVSSWIQEVRQQAGDTVGIMLVGNKTDLGEQRKVSHTDAQHFARTRAVEYIETTATDPKSVEKAFVNLLDLVYPALKNREFHKSRRFSSWHKESRRRDRENIRESMRKGKTQGELACCV